MKAVEMLLNPRPWIEEYQEHALTGKQEETVAAYVRILTAGSNNAMDRPAI